MASLVVLGGIAQADDHLANALAHGLKDNANAQATLKSDAPGQGSPFSGHDTRPSQQLMRS